MKMKRSRVEITYAILNVIANGSSKTSQIMLAANLSSVNYRQLIDYLVVQQFIEIRKADYITKYYITEYGLKLLEIYKELISYIGEVFSK